MTPAGATPGRILRWVRAGSQRGRRLGWSWRLTTSLLLWLFMMSLGLALTGLEFKG